MSENEPIASRLSMSLEVIESVTDRLGTYYLSWLPVSDP